MHAPLSASQSCTATAGLHRLAGSELPVLPGVQQALRLTLLDSVQATRTAEATGVQSTLTRVRGALQGCRAGSIKVVWAGYSLGRSSRCCSSCPGRALICLCSFSLADTRGGCSSCCTPTPPNSSARDSAMPSLPWSKSNRSHSSVDTSSGHPSPVPSGPGSSK